MHELKSKIYDGLSNMSLKSDSVSFVENIKYGSLEKKCEELEFKNKELKKHNQWLMNRVAEQGNIIKNYSLREKLISARKSNDELKIIKSTREKSINNVSMANVNVNRSNCLDSLTMNARKHDDCNRGISLNYYTISDQVDKLSVSVFKHIMDKSYMDITKYVFRESLFI